MKDYHYTITYLDKIGKGFSELEPWIYNKEPIYDLMEAMESRDNLVNDGFKDVKIYRVEWIKLDI